MALERTLSIVKPDGVSANLIGEVLRRLEKAGLTIIAARMRQLSQAEAEGHATAGNDVAVAHEDKLARLVAGQ